LAHNSVHAVERKKATGLLATAAAAAAFGVYPSAAKLAYANGANACFVIICTTFARAFVLLAQCWLSGRNVVPLADCRKAVLAAGLLQAISVFGIIGSLAYLPGPVTIVILFTYVFMLLVYLSLRGELQINALSSAVTLSALAGVSFVVNVWDTHDSVSTAGVVLALVAALTTMFRLRILGRQLADRDPLEIGAGVMTIAAVCTLLLIPVITPAPPQTAAGFYWLLIACTFLAAGTVGMFYGIAHLGAFDYSLMAKTEPVFTALFAVLILSEVLKASQYLGMVLVLGSLLVYQLRAPAQIKATLAPED
jgi:drug/metabolite transporter (DMT)-like permease